MHYVIHAYDFTDEQAYERRLAARPAHFAGARQLKADGHFVMGGALLDANGRMMGSMMVLHFDNADQLRAWQQHEPYIVGRVWERVDIKPFRPADI